MKNEKVATTEGKQFIPYLYRREQTLTNKHTNKRGREHALTQLSTKRVC